MAIIPARGGSKRIPRKNIRDLNGKPLLAWSLQTATNSGLFSRVVVSTDDEEIEQIASDSGAHVSSPRPAQLSDDFASTLEVMAHEVALAVVDDPGLQFVCCIYPAAFAINRKDLTRSLDVLQSSDKQFVAAVTRYEHPVQRAMRMARDGSLTLVTPVAASMRTQDLEPMWHDAGQFYWGTTQAWLTESSILQKACAYPIEGSRVVDIDTEEDWKRAELLLKSLA